MLAQQTKLNKRERRLLRKQGIILNTGMTIKRITPLTDNQHKAFDAYQNGKHLFLYGTAGTGKTFNALYLSLKDVLKENYQRVVIVRSVVPSRNIGFLPGSHIEKSKMYELPYQEICSELFERYEAYSILKQKEQIDFMTTSFLRGLTFSNSIIVIDECQNLNWQELTTILTRIGNNCRVILCGDIRQSDLESNHGRYDLMKIMDICKKMNTFEFVHMNPNDIVRSGFVKDFILTCEELGY